MLLTSLRESPLKSLKMPISSFYGCSRGTPGMPIWAKSGFRFFRAHFLLHFWQLGDRKVFLARSEISAGIYELPKNKIELQEIFPP